MSVTYLQYAGAKKPLGDWGIRGAVLTRTAFGRDTLQLTAPGLSVTSAPIFATDASVVLWSDNTRRFSGTVTSRPVYGRGASESHTYVITGPWGQLERLIYQQPRNLHEEPEVEASSLQRVFGSRAVLFAGFASGESAAITEVESLTPGEVIEEVLDYAESKGVAIKAGAVELAFEVPWEEAADITCAEAIKRAVRWAPDAIGSIDYAPATPVFNLARRAALTPISIDLTAANLVTDFSITPRSDLKVPGVRFDIEEITEVAAAEGRVAPRAKVTTQSVGSPEAVGGIIATIELGGQGTDTPEPIPANLATNYWSTVNWLPYEGSITLKARDTANTLYIGAKLNFTNGRAEWATMDAPIQEVTEDLFAGVMTGRFGPSTRLGAAEFADFLRYQNARKKSGYLSNRGTGEGNTSAVSGWEIKYNSSGVETFELDLCNPERRVRITGTLVS